MYKHGKKVHDINLDELCSASFDEVSLGVGIWAGIKNVSKAT